jgi:hypothetical protein
MSSNFYITCASCGYPENNHNFRHIFKKSILEQVYNIFYTDCNQYPFQEKEICGQDQCSGKKFIHGSIIQHEYIPKIIKYRNIKIYIPDNAECCHSDCKDSEANRTVENHVPNPFKPPTHKFTVNLFLKNKQENDIISVVSKNDVKIDYKLVDKLYPNSILDLSALTLN